MPYPSSKCAWSNFSPARVKSPPIACTPFHKCINLDAKGLNSSPSRTTKACPEIFERVNTLSMCNQMVTSEIREQFPAHFVQILIISFITY